MSQPIDQVYPNTNTVMRQPNPSHNNGSFGPVFIVLAVIAVISAVACVLGRLCSRRHHLVKEGNHHHHHRRGDNHPKADKQGHALGPREWESTQKPVFKMRERGDVEFGFDKRNPSAKVANNGGSMMMPPQHNGGHVMMPPQHNGGPMMMPPQHNGGIKPQVRFADNI